MEELKNTDLRPGLPWLRSKPWWAMVRLPALLVIYCVALGACLWLAVQLRFDFAVPFDFLYRLYDTWPWVVVVQIGFLVGCRHFSDITRYFGLPEAKRLGLAVVGAAIFLLGVKLVSGMTYAPPRGVILVDAMLAFGAISGLRLSYRMVHERLWSAYSDEPRERHNVAIVGAGDVGSNLVRELSQRRGLGLLPVFFLDDDRRKWNCYLHGVRVVGSTETMKKWATKYRVSKVIIAMPSAPARRIAEVAMMAQQIGLSCVAVPAIDQLTSGKMAVSQLRPINIEDLLGREPVRLEIEAIRKTFEGRVVMVTGAGGSIGTELCRQVATCGPKRLLLVEQCEVQLFAIEQEMIGKGYGERIVPLAANILDTARMEAIFKAHRPSVVLHAAAHKHVPMMEQQPTEAIRNNAIGSARLGDLALNFGVELFVMISTDKAVNPTSVMGASKRLAEIYLQSLHAHRPDGTKFICIRFGNVLGSSGSVVPTFTAQIAAGGPVTVTHPDMVRYFMTIPEAVGLVLQSCAQGEGGEIFVLDMGKPVKIVDLARQMIQLSGYRPGIDIEIRYVGLRPGEKLFEEFKFERENFHPTRHPRIMRFLHRPEPFIAVQSAFEKLEKELHSKDVEELKQLMRHLVPEYTPYSSAGQGKAAKAPLNQESSQEPRPAAALNRT